MEAHAVSEPQQHPPGREPSLTVEEVIARVQDLADETYPAGYRPLRWQVEAYYLGDLTAIAAAAIHSHRGSRNSLPG
jgi:hypothetical protein